MHAGRGLLARTQRSAEFEDSPADALANLCRRLFDHRGEASGLVLADEILDTYQSLSPEERMHFFALLNEQFDPDPQAITYAAEAYRTNPGFETVSALAKAVEAPRQRLIRRLNMAPGGTRRLVSLRGHVLDVIDERPALRALDNDLRHLLISWFNRGFLALERIDWNSPASVLEKIIAYEAVHEIGSLEDLRTRLAEDRRCFAFFHPAMPDNPLIFVQVALTRGLVGAIGPLITGEREIINVRDADTALFYSISNCHRGLSGINFGNFLLKQVIEELRRDLENIRQFVTLSPVTGFSDWLAGTSAQTLPDQLGVHVSLAREILQSEAPMSPRLLSKREQAILMQLCAYFLLNVKRGGEPADAVARFHLGNGASLERMHWAADPSEAGLARSAGIMANYVYRLGDIEKNHESYFAESDVVASSEIRNLADRAASSLVGFSPAGTRSSSAYRS